MKQVFWLSSGIGLGMIIQACATVTFPYTSYGIDLKDQKLLASASSGEPDESLSICAANATSASPCIAFMEPAYLALKKDYEDKEIALQSCQQQLKALQ
jgi:hypothetical protein